MQSESQIVIDYVLPDRFKGSQKGKPPLPSYTLALLAAQTPKELLGCRVVTRVHDEQIRGPYKPRDAQPNILCLTYLTTGAPRAYQISDEASCSRSHDGNPIIVIHGGVHATSLSLEALKHSHIVVRGELTGEFQHHLLEHALRMDPKDKVVTRIPSPPTVLKRPIADWSWMNPGDYLVAPVVQTSVGCPFGCSFCSVTEVFGAQMRAVCLNELRAELEQLPKTRLIGVIDDNFLQGIQDRYINHCIAVATLFHELGFRWVAEVTVRTLIDAQAKLRERGSNLDLVEYFAKCGCRGFFFGIETLEENGAGLSKVKSQQDTANLIKHCHQCGLMVLGAFVLGVGETETADHAKRILEFAVEETKLDFAQFTINTPMPGARSFLTGIRDNTIFNFDWELYDGQHCVARHPVMSPQELEESHFWLYQEFYRWRSIGTRVLPALLTPKPLTIQRGLISLPINGALHQSSRRWKQRLLSTSGNRPIIAQPDETVLEQVASALQNYAKPADLFNLKHPDGLSRPINTK